VKVSKTKYDDEEEDEDYEEKDDEEDKEDEEDEEFEEEEVSPKPNIPLPSRKGKLLN